MKKFKGFTLIELIVVIAIIGVLAAILVPAMMGWVLKSRITTDNNNASEVCTQLQSLLTDRDAAGEPILDDGIIIFKNFDFSGDVSSDTEKALLKKINDSLTDMSGVTWAAKVENGFVKGVSLSGNGCKAVGGFPVQCPSGTEYRMTGGDIENYLDYASGKTPWPQS